MWNTESLDYEGAIYRPPSEAGSIILQVTVGCSHNKCTFCTSFKDKQFRIKEQATIVADLKKAARLYPKIKRLFVADGDALIMPMSYYGSHRRAFAVGRAHRCLRHRPSNPEK